MKISRLKACLYKDRKKLFYLKRVFLSGMKENKNIVDLYYRGTDQENA